MAKSAISSDVKAANSKLAQFLRRREEEEMILQIGKKKPKQLKEEKLPGGRGRWMLEPDYRAPTPMVDRPRTVHGATSFHFSYISISKEAIPTVGGIPVEGAFGKPKNAALEHSKYIERDGAAERSAGAQHAGYIERDGAIEKIDTSALIAEAIEKQIAHVVNETPTEAEAEILGLVDAVPDGIPSVFSNISADAFERMEFWRAVERIEATPRAHQLILDPEESHGWWQAVADTNILDPEFKNHALLVLEAYRQHLKRPLDQGQKRPPFEAEPYPVSAERAGKLIQQSQRMVGFQDYAPPFKFQSGRGGRIQFRLVAELPHELSAEDRALIVQNFCDHLGSLEERKNPDGTSYPVGMMYTAVIHAPDAHNDARNYHLHVVAYDRPARFLHDKGQWDFEVAEVYQDPGSRKDRVRYPHRQNKIGQVSQGTKKTGVENSGVDFIPSLRRKFASINNAVLKARGIHRKLDHRKYTEMGIDRTPTDHLGTKAAALEAIGVPTAVGQLNAIAIWSDAERAIRREAVKAERTFRQTQDDYTTLAADVTAIDAVHPALPDFRKLLAERERMIADTAADREAIMTFDHMEAKAKSRALRTRQTCVQFLADIESGDADRNTRMMRSVIEDRWKGAQAHITEIDKALAPHRQALANAAENIEKREARCAEIDVALQPLIYALEERLRLAGIDRTLAAKKQSEKSAAASNPANESAAEPARADAHFEDGVLTIEGLNEDIGSTDLPTVPLQPATIEGLPIVSPTLAPRVDPIDAELAQDRSTPKGLDPLRPEAVSDEVNLKPEVIISDIAASPREGAGADLNNEPLSGQGAGQVAPKTSPVEPGAGSSELVEPPVDRRKKVSDPTLFELPIQEAPPKPGTSKGEYADWDALINRISANRIPVKAEPSNNGDLKFAVPSLSPEDNALLHAKRFSRRAVGRLAAIEKQQQQEITRLVSWIRSQGQNPEMLLIEGRTAKLGKSVPKSVRTLFAHWASHSSTIEAVRAENDRRIDLEKTIMNQPAPTLEQIADDTELRKAEAARRYPAPDLAHTPEVRDFLKLLHAAAPKEELQAAADKIHESASAREDVNLHTVELAITYRSYSEGHDQRLAERQRNDRKGR